MADNQHDPEDTNSEDKYSGDPSGIPWQLYLVGAILAAAFFIVLVVTPLNK